MQEGRRARIRRRLGLESERFLRWLLIVLWPVVIVAFLLNDGWIWPALLGVAGGLTAKWLEVRRLAGKDE